MTLAQKENRLNEELSQHPLAVLYAQFQYLTNTQRKEHCGHIVLSNAISKGKLGTILRKMDRVQFLELSKYYV
jgi:hypothetical protein